MRRKKSAMSASLPATLRAKRSAWADEPPAKVDLSAALSLLDEKEHAIIVLRFYESKKISEIAQILGENENTVKSRMYRAFKKMKLELEQEGALPPFEIGG